MTAKSSHLKEQVAALQKALAQLAASQAEMDKLRQEELTAYVPNKADMELAGHISAHGRQLTPPRQSAAEREARGQS